MKHLNQVTLSIEECYYYYNHILATVTYKHQFNMLCNTPCSDVILNPPYLF